MSKTEIKNHFQETQDTLSNLETMINTLADEIDSYGEEKAEEVDEDEAEGVLENYQGFSNELRYIAEGLDDMREELARLERGALA